MKKLRGINSLSGAVLRSASGGSGSGSTRANKRNQRKAMPKLLIQQPASAVKIYTAPSLEGGDVEYKKLISGKVDNSKPSFA